jgi:MSHA biogenesis protein MshL
MNNFQRCCATASVAALTIMTVLPADAAQRWYTKRAKGPMVATLKPVPALSVVSSALVVPAALALNQPLPSAPAQTALAGAAVAAVATPSSASVARTNNDAARFDLSVSNAAAAQVFMQIASGTSYNMLVSPDVSGQISMTLKDSTVLEAMESIRELFGYDFRVSGNRIFVYSNAVQTRLYRINYLPGRREGASDIRVTSSSLSKAGTGSNGSGSGNSNNSGSNTNNSSNSSGSSSARQDDSSHVRTTSDADFWQEVKLSLQTLIGQTGGRGVVLNPAAGVVVVRATAAEQRQVDQYLKAIQLSVSRQVMIEAKIVEVSLSKDAQTGINWGAFGRILGGTVGVSLGVAAPGTVLQTAGALSTGDGTTAQVGANINASPIGRGFYGVALQASNFAALLNFLQTQGDVSVLSSPRIATLNNQKAVLKVGSDELYVTGITTTTTSSGTSSVSTPTVNLQPFFSGIALDVTPQIDDQGNVILHVHPSVSAVVERQKVIDLGSLGSYKLPLATSAINETDSIVRVRDGQIVAIGGLMKQETRAERSGVTGLSELPLVGGLFRQTNDVTTKRELVILMRPTVIAEDGTWPEAMSEATAAPPAPIKR